jgi:hypothetical protein
MTTYVLRKDKKGNLKLVDAAKAAPKTSSGLYVISDEMAATRHMADGKMYTSKAKFREATRAAGCVEVGNEMATLTRPRKPTFMSREERRRTLRDTLRRQLHGE